MKTLIVDDNEQNLYMLQVLLGGHGYDVVSAANGVEALEKARHEPPAMIITDILMPVMDGFTLCREWKMDERLKHIPFIFYTATYIDPKDEELALSLGADRFIVKPMEPDDFMKIVQEVIKDVDKKEIVPKEPTLKEDKEVFKLYSERLVNKLEKKMLDLEKEITKRKRAEEELKKHRDHLAEMVEARTKELQDAQVELVHKARLAALGQLTATVAHEIRNPLGTVQTSIFSIGDAIERKEMRRVDRALSLAERNIRRCDGIITELLDFTRQKELKKAPMDIDAWLEGLLDDHKLPDEIEYKTEMNCGILIPFDPQYFRRAVINVFTNAVQALEEEESAGKELKVKTAVAGNRLEIRVIDSGPGIPDDIREKIFDPFFSTKNIGVGLGLAVVKDIMAEHGGGIEVESEVGKGTAVVLWLPVE